MSDAAAPFYTERLYFYEQLLDAGYDVPWPRADFYPDGWGLSYVRDCDDELLYEFLIETGIDLGQSDDDTIELARSDLVLWLRCYAPDYADDHGLDPDGLEAIDDFPAAVRRFLACMCRAEANLADSIDNDEYASLLRGEAARAVRGRPVPLERPVTVACALIGRVRQARREPRRSHRLGAARGSPASSSDDPESPLARLIRALQRALGGRG
jgi:hypothetical protein